MASSHQGAGHDRSRLIVTRKEDEDDEQREEKRNSSCLEPGTFSAAVMFTNN